MTDVSIHDDVPNPVANTALVRDSGNTTYETREVVPVDLTGTSGRMALLYDFNDNQAELEEILPTLVSASATDVGKVLVANGAYYVDVKGAFVIFGNGVPTSGDGWDGAFWLDLATMEEYGPKGTALDGTADPGVWVTSEAGKGRRTKAALKTLPKFTGSIVPTVSATAAPIAAVLTERMGTHATTRKVGTWTTDANGVVVPEDGTYEAFWSYPVFVSGATTVEVYPLVNGVAAPTPPEKQSYSQSAGFLTAHIDFGHLELSKNDSVGVDLKITAGTVFFGAGVEGSFRIRRIA